MHCMVTLSHTYEVWCIRKGEEIWRETFHNLVPEGGRNHYLDATLKTGFVSPVWYVGLKGTGTESDSDTMASHVTWAEVTAYSNVTRPTWTPGTIATSSVSNSASPAVFNINASTTVYGLFLCNDSTVGGTSGILLGVGDLAIPRTPTNGDTVNAVITCNMAYSGS